MAEQDRIREIREREAAATDGPWRPVIQPNWHPFVVMRERSENGGQLDTSILRREEDADFIAHSREDVPFLLAALARSEARVEALVEAGNAMAERLAYEHSECDVSVCSAARNVKAWREALGTAGGGAG